MTSNKEISVNTFKAIYQHIDTLTREHITDPTDFLVIREAIDEMREQIEQSTETENIENLKELLNTAIDNNAPDVFFQKLSETRIKGSIAVENIAQLTARLGLIYYFELLSDEADFSDLNAFRERAIDLKRQAENTIERIKSAPMSFEATSKNGSKCKQSSKTVLIESQRQVIKRIDEMIYLLGQSVSLKPIHHLTGSWNALVASYHLYGDISYAYDITELSLGVSGAKLNGVNYYPEANNA